MSSDELLKQDLQQEQQILNNDKVNQAEQQSDKLASSSNLTEELNALYTQKKIVLLTRSLLVYKL